MKIKFKSKPSDVIELTGRKQSEMESLHTHNQRISTKRPTIQNSKEVRSKSLKNAIRVGESTNLFGSSQKKQGNKKIVTEMQLDKMLKSRKGKQNLVEYTSQNTTEATQSSVMSETSKKVWMRILEIIKNVNICLIQITIQPGNLDWPEEYIVMDKKQAEINLHQILDEVSPNSKTREKMRRHICITRVTIYLYAGFILHHMDAKPIINIF